MTRRLCARSRRCLDQILSTAAFTPDEQEIEGSPGQRPRHHVDHENASFISPAIGVFTRRVAGLRFFLCSPVFSGFQKE